MFFRSSSFLLILKLCVFLVGTCIFFTQIVPLFVVRHRSAFVWPLVESKVNLLSFFSRGAFLFRIIIAIKRDAM